MKIFLLISIFIIKCLLLQTIDNYNKKNGYYCKGKLYDPFMDIKKIELYYICTILKEDNNIMISIKHTLLERRKTKKSRNKQG